MASHVSAIEALAEQPVAVDPANIEAEFDRIWRETSGQGLEASSVRLRVVNFVAIARDAAAVERFEAVMAALPGRHPGRGVLALVEDGRSGVEALISAYCWRSAGGGRHVCSEQVLLRGGPADERSLASLVLSLLVPDVPVFAWLFGRPEGQTPLAAEIVAVADRVIVDSADGDDPPAMLQAVMHLQDVYRVGVIDLAWRRLAVWRSIVASFFDGDDGAGELAAIESVEIISGEPAPSTGALLLAGWLASRLALTVADAEFSAGGLDATLYMGSRGVRIRTKRDDGRMAVRGVVVRTRSAALEARFDDASGHISVAETWDGRQFTEMAEPPPSDDVSLVSGALDDPATDVFSDALRSALRLLGV